MKGQMQAGGGGRPGPGMAGPGMSGPGGPGGGSDKEPDFRTPEGAVQAFLDALKAKDLSRLTEATALRAQSEAKKHNQDMFKRIFEGTLSDSELNDLAAKLEGYQISGVNQAKSSGKLGVILSKRGNNSTWTIVIEARREKKGWGVCDISQPAELKNPRFGPVRSQPKRT
jgi:hypothetical protein